MDPYGPHQLAPDNGQPLRCTLAATTRAHHLVDMAESLERGQRFGTEIHSLQSQHGVWPTVYCHFHSDSRTSGPSTKVASSWSNSRFCAVTVQRLTDCQAHIRDHTISCRVGARGIWQRVCVGVLRERFRRAIMHQDAGQHGDLSQWYVATPSKLGLGGVWYQFIFGSGAKR